MSHAKKLVVLPPNGQISIGKTWAGKEIQIEEISDNQIMITSGKFIPAHHATFYTEKAMKQLEDFDKWVEKQPIKGSNIKELRKKFVKK